MGCFIMQSNNNWLGVGEWMAVIKVNYKLGKMENNIMCVNTTILHVRKNYVRKTFD